MKHTNEQFFFPTKASIDAQKVEESQQVVVQTQPLTKAQKARIIFAEAYPDGKTTIVQRKDILARFVNEAGLTKAGAGTYLQNMKDKAGITVKRTVVTA